MQILDMITKHWPVNVNTVRGHTPSALSWTAFEFKHEQRWLWSLHPLPLFKKGKQSHKCRHQELVTLFKVVPSSSCNKEFRLIAGRAWPSIMMLAPKLTTCNSQFTYYSQNHCYDYNHALIILHHYIIYATYTVCGLCVCVPLNTRRYFFPLSHTQKYTIAPISCPAVSIVPAASHTQTWW